MKHPTFDRSFANQVAAAAAVLRKAYDGGAFIVDPEQVATEMLEAAYLNRGCWLTGRLRGGDPVRIEFEDKGDVTPGWDKKGNRFEAFTSWMRFTVPEAASRGLAPVVMETYSQVDRYDAEASGDVAAFRWKNDLDCLEGMGIDPSTVEIEASA